MFHCNKLQQHINSRSVISLLTFYDSTFGFESKWDKLTQAALQKRKNYHKPAVRSLPYWLFMVKRMIDIQSKTPWCASGKVTNYHSLVTTKFEASWHLKGSFLEKLINASQNVPIIIFNKTAKKFLPIFFLLH